MPAFPALPASGATRCWPQAAKTQPKRPAELVTDGAMQGGTRRGRQRPVRRPQAGSSRGSRGFAHSGQKTAVRCRAAGYRGRAARRAKIKSSFTRDPADQQQASSPTPACCLPSVFIKYLPFLLLSIVFVILVVNLP